jgi:hypothetical protein
MNRFRKTVLVLSLTLVSLTGYIVLSPREVKSVEAFNTQVKEVEDYSVKANLLKDAVRKENKLIVLQGERAVRYIFDYTKDEISYTGSSNPVKFLAGKLNELKTKHITVETKFNYTYSYDLKELDIEIIDNKIHIALKRGDVKLEPIAEDSSNRVIKTETGILSGGFTPQQTAAVLNIVKVHAFNNLVNDNELYIKALEAAQENIKGIALKLGIKNVQFDIYNTETIENEEIEVIK